MNRPFKAPTLWLRLVLAPVAGSILTWVFSFQSNLTGCWLVIFFHPERRKWSVTPAAGVGGPREDLLVCIYITNVRDFIVSACKWTNRIELRSNFERTAHTQKQKVASCGKNEQAVRDRPLFLHICRVKLHDIRYLLLVNEDPCWESYRLRRGNER